MFLFSIQYYHVSFSGGITQMKTNIIKSKIPIVWIDTYAIIRMAKLINGIKLPEYDEKRYLKLYELNIFESGVGSSCDILVK